MKRLDKHMKFTIMMSIVRNFHRDLIMTKTLNYHDKIFALIKNLTGGFYS